jgi:hypothetical protein
MLRIFAFDTPPRIDEPELIDDDTQPYKDFRASMSDVRRANRFLGGTGVVTEQVALWLRAARCAGQTQPITFLDVATGSADIPEAIVRTANRVQMPVRVIGLDYSAPILRFARETVGKESAIRLMRGDAFRLPFEDYTVDYVICSLAFHHFSWDQCGAALHEMERVARYGWLINDVRRAWSAWYLIRAVAALARVNRLTRHDAPASVLRAYTPAEFRALGATLPSGAAATVRLQRRPFYRMALIREKSRLETQSL